MSTMEKQACTKPRLLTFDLFHGATEPLPGAEHPETDAVDDDCPDSNDGVVERQGVNRLPSKKGRM